MKPTNEWIDGDIKDRLEIRKCLFWKLNNNFPKLLRSLHGKKTSLQKLRRHFHDDVAKNGRVLQNF